MYEEQLQQSVLSFVEREGYTFFVQIPHLMGSIDVVGIKGSECIVIETKVSKWKSALRQALGYGYGAEKSYIALPDPTAKNVLEKHREIFERYGIGIIEVSDSASIILASETKIPSPVFKQIILNQVHNRKLSQADRVSALRRRLNK